MKYWKQISKKRDDFPISAPDWYWTERELKKVIWFYTRGLGDNLISMAHMAKYAKEYNLPFYIYPYFTTYFSHFYLYSNIQLYNLFFQYFQPKIDYKVLSWNTVIDDAFLYDAKHNLYEVALDSLGADNLSIIKKYIKLSGFEKFDDEYNTLNKKYDLQNLQGGHLRLVYGNEPRVDLLIQYILSLKKKDSFLAMDTLSYLQEYKNILPKKIFVLSDVYRVEKNTDIEYDFILNENQTGNEMLKNNYKSFIQHREQALKEAYFISKCKTFVPSKSSFSLIIQFLRNWYQ